MRGRLGEGVRCRVTPGSPLYSRLLVNGAGLPAGGAVPAVSAVSAVAGARRQCGTVSRRVQKRPVESAMPAAGDTVATPAVQCSAGQIIYPADPVKEYQTHTSHFCRSFFLFYKIVFLIFIVCVMPGLCSDQLTHIQSLCLL